MKSVRSTLQWIFLGSSGLRNGWRFSIFAGLWLISTHVILFVLRPIYSFSRTGFTPADIAVFELAGALYFLVVSVLLVRLERHREPWFGLDLKKSAFKLFGAGGLWGFAVITLVVLVCWATGYLSFHGLAIHGPDLWKYLGLWLGSMLLAGFTEEMQFRGYALASLTRGIGFWPAALLLSLVFGLDHLQKPMENLPDILNIALLGLFACYSVRRTGNLWFAIGFHAAFDFFALSFYGSPNTGNNGLPLAHHLVDTRISGPAWLTGGPQGFEASWLMTLLVVVMFVLLHKLYPRNQYPHD